LILVTKLENYIFVKNLNKEMCNQITKNKILNEIDGIDDHTINLRQIKNINILQLEKNVLDIIEETEKIKIKNNEIILHIVYK